MTMTRHSPVGQTLIGVDVGGTKCAAGIVRVADGVVLARRWFATQPERGGDAIFADMVAAIRSLQREADELGTKVSAAGLGVAELVGTEGEILSGATIAWSGRHVGGLLSDAIGLPVTIEADVRAAARAEARLGAGRSFRSFLYVTIGTGISASLVLDSVPFAGARGLTGTFASARGLIPNDAGELTAGPPLESFAAGPALAARYTAVHPGFSGTARDVLSLGESGDALAQSVVTTAADALGAAVAQLVNVLDPEAVVVGGGLGLAKGRYCGCLEISLRRHIWSDIHRDLPILSAEFGNDAGLVGAALAASTSGNSEPLRPRTE